ncbi:MAG: hypothetical protein COB67_05570, partial [SAR324 cluster bacterium]
MACQSGENSVAFSELWLHHLWSEQKIFTEPLQTGDGRSLKIIFPGWYNRSWGPDFKEARILIDNTEFFGDIEIHLKESAWTQHHHHQDKAYHKVILHVFFDQEGPGVKTIQGDNLPTFDLTQLPFFKQRKDQELPQEISLDELPGACGLSLRPQDFSKIKKLIFQAAEQRFLDKAQVFQQQLANCNQDQWEEILYCSLCKSLGYSPYSDNFLAMAQRFPYRY